ncbi:MAG: lysine--tRNA ligase [Robiginitomaculum sp.]|nr:lysine--tRNA ligase [Robiginitomaculum sp.]MDQ7078986.1 lysine--tRNA ligase [Robiginitomaculum sp.]
MMQLNELALSAKAWPFEQARALYKRLEQMEKAGKPKDGPVVFETGYGPSGLPHIGTFGEVVRTSMVRHAFHVLTNHQIPTRMICVSDDMDGMRKVPSNVPNQETLATHLGKPLSAVPDPFSNEYESFAHHNNARLRAFLDGFGFEYEFLSATELYKSGAYDAMLLRALEKFDEIMAVMLPTLGAERQATYSPFLPISPKTGKVLYVPMKSVNAQDGTITFDDEDGTETTIPVTGGHAKLQWKPDFGMRWAALGVDFEMFGKDHQDNAPIYSKICKILGVRPPTQYVYELFLDEKGEKISKSKGNGISVEEWLAYAPAESLSLYQFQKPRVAKKLYFDVIPKTVDEYLQHLAAFPSQDEAQQMANPVWHIHEGDVPAVDMPVTFALLLNLVSAANAAEKETLWGFISRYAPEASADTHPLLDRLVGYAIRYYQDFVKPHKTYRAPDEKERAALSDLAARLGENVDETDAKELQNLVFAVGKDHEFEPLRAWFGTLYEVLLGQKQGPRFGSFIAIYGVAETISLIERALAGELVKT